MTPPCSICKVNPSHDPSICRECPWWVEPIPVGDEVTTHPDPDLIRLLIADGLHALPYGVFAAALETTLGHELLILWGVL